MLIKLFTYEEERVQQTASSSLVRGIPAPAAHPGAEEIHDADDGNTGDNAKRRERHSRPEEASMEEEILGGL